MELGTMNGMERVEDEFTVKVLLDIVPVRVDRGPPGSVRLVAAESVELRVV